MYRQCTLTGTEEGRSVGLWDVRNSPGHPGPRTNEDRKPKISVLLR